MLFNSSLHLCGRSVARFSQVPLLGWEVMREFFQVYCGAPELLMLTSRRFQHTAFLEELKEVTTMGQLGCVGCLQGCGD